MIKIKGGASATSTGMWKLLFRLLKKPQIGWRSVCLRRSRRRVNPRHFVMSSFFGILIRCSALRALSTGLFLMFLALGAPEALAEPGHPTHSASPTSASPDGAYDDRSSGADHDHLQGDGAACCVACTASLMQDGRQDTPSELRQLVHLLTDMGRSYQLPDRLDRPPRG
jgi:hypothetical protein